MTTQRFQVVRVRGAPVSDAELLADLRSVAARAGTVKVSQPLYDQHGRFDTRNLARRFGTWNKALSAAGLEISNEAEYSDERLFSNILTLWQHYGRQPRRAELAHSPSIISQSPYQRRFRSWTGALESFVAWANAAEGPALVVSSNPITETKPRTGRDPSLRLRFKVLLRDRFMCCSCGASPATTSGTELHVDHIVAWSKGGERGIENLRTLCSRCNLGKSNVL
ncbi:MAG: hypothetical protein C0404_01795 [Verrucomicrobia bacterium]|nr:hypothetical protein [Verrucomicrobiota bacterium]